MMTTELLKSFGKEYISSFSKEMGEPAWLTDLRIHALEWQKINHCQNRIKQKLINGISLNLKNILSKVKTFQS